jgi:hypothetical protein
MHPTRRYPVIFLSFRSLSPDSWSGVLHFYELSLECSKTLSNRIWFRESYELFLKKSDFETMFELT